jgi:hypothetical protein
VRKGHHHQRLHRRAHPAQQVLTPRQPDLRALHAWPGPMLVLPDRSSARSVRKDHHHQLAHRRVHPVRKGHTPLKRGRSAHLVVPGDMQIVLDQ